MSQIITDDFVKEFLKLVRKDKSQGYVNKKLGFNSNRTAKWESGIKKITWEEFYNLCDACNNSVETAVHRYFSYYDSAKNGNAFLRWLLYQIPVQEVAKGLEVSTQQVRRWLREESEPRLKDILSAIEVYHQWLLYPFLSKLAPMDGIQKIVSFTGPYRNLAELILENPEVGLIYEALYLEDYQDLSEHKQGILASSVGLPLHSELNAIKHLEANDLIGLKNGKYVVHDKKESISTWWDKTADVRAKRYWNQRIHGFLSELNPEDAYPDKTHFGHLVFSASEECWKLIADELRNFYMKARKATQEDKNPVKKEVGYLGAQLIPNRIIKVRPED